MSRLASDDTVVFCLILVVARHCSLDGHTVWEGLLIWGSVSGDTVSAQRPIAPQAESLKNGKPRDVENLNTAVTAERPHRPSYRMAY